MRRALIPLVFVLSALLWACSGDKPFRITGELSDGASTNLYVRYYGNNALNTLITAASDGKFEATGVIQEPTVARILDKDDKLLAIVFLREGDEVNVSVDRTNPWMSKVTGNEVNEALTTFFNANAKTLGSDNFKDINTLVAKYVKAHPADPASAVLLGFVYDASLDPAETASLAGSLAETARLPNVVGLLTVQAARFASPEALGKVTGFKYLKDGNDSALTFSPGDKDVTLLVFSDERSNRDKSVVPALKDIYKTTGASRLQIMDMIIVSDTTAMKGMTRRDSADWTQAWTPGGLLSDQLAPLAVPALPYYIVTDATGAQRYRGASLDDARDAIGKIAR